MNAEWKGWALGAVVAVIAAVAAFLAVPAGPGAVGEPLEVAGTGWERWTLWDGRAAAPWGVERVMRFEAGPAEAWFAAGAGRPEGDTLAWREVPGGWLAVNSAGEERWGEGPVEGELRRVWHPQRHGVTRLEVREGGIWSTFEAVGLEGAARPVQATFFGEEPTGAELPAAWSGWQEAAMAGGRADWSRVEADRGAAAHGHPALCGRGDGTRLVVERADGSLLTIYGWVDSSGVAGEWAERGWAWGDSTPWARIEEDGLHVGTGVWGQISPSSGPHLPPVDAWGWTAESGYREARHVGGGRLAWNGAPTASPVASSPAVPAQVTASAPSPPVTVADQRVIGQVRNHRSGKRMEIRWENGRVTAAEGSQVVWALNVEGQLIGNAVEVDLYRNNKFQCAFATSEGMHLVDVLGREVSGFPLRPRGGVSAWLVADYDRNEQYRFLVATPGGQLLNYRDEGEPTPGWDFAPNGKAVAHLAHLRIGSKDYLYAGQTDRSVRLLSRTGSDRVSTSVEVPPTQVPAFRLGGSIGSSTVLFIGADGWVEERTFGSNEPVGMSRRTQGTSVSTEDTNGDGKPEVVVTTLSGARSVWNQRNEQIE